MPRVKRTNRRRGGVARRRRAIPRAPRLLDGFTIVRRQPPSYIANSAISGVAQVSNPASGSGLNMIVLGTPVAHPIFTNTYSVPFAAAFTLDMLSQYLDLTGISDQYKISNVELRFQYNASDVAGIASNNTNQPTFLPMLKYVIDYDDGSVETPTQLQAKMGLRSKALSGGKQHSVRFSPRVADAVYATSLTTGYAVPARPMFLDSQTANIPHYGIKGYLENFSLGSTSGGMTSCITIDVIYTVKLKGLQ